MKVYVTQGHEEGIGLEVFFKTCLFLSTSELENICLLAFKEGVKETLISLRLPFEIEDDHIQLAHAKIPVCWLFKKSFSQTLSCLDLGMRLSESGGILYTLPTSKDQFPGFAGHTEYFRHAYKRPELGMFFSSPSMQLLLVTDHICLKDLSSVLTQERIFNCIENAYQTLTRWAWPAGNFIVAGVNPHAGENGLIGSEDIRVTDAVRQIQNKHSLTIKGPFPGDTILREREQEQDILVFMFHDQGLPLFKGMQGLVGSNITLGLPYPRFSTDHGTSFSLFGKNEADYRGCQFSLKQALSQLKRMENGQNSGYQSKSS